MQIREDLLKALLSTTATLAFVAAAPNAFAQDDQDTAVPDSLSTLGDEEDEVDEIVATGIRQAIEDARNIKRNADTAVDSITASDVSTLPDLSVAEALARVPGVVVQRIQLSDASANPNGSSGDFPSPEGGGNLVRGLTLVRSEFNGRDAFSANGGRSLDFGTIPPELIGAVDVYKNTSADLIEGGLGGSVNLRTLEPFDQSGMLAVFTADGTYTDLRDEITPDLSAVVGNRWDTAAGEFGLLGSISYSELKSDLNGFQVGAVTPLPVDANGLSINGSNDGGLTNVNGENVEIDRYIATPAGFQLRTNEVDRTRESYYIAGQYQNADRTLQATAKYALIKNEAAGNERTLEWFPDAESAVAADGPFGFNRTSFAGAYTTTPFNGRVPLCNGSNDPGAFCETTLPATELYEDGLITNNNRDWIGGFGPNFTNLGIRNTETSETDDLSLNVKWRPADQWYVTADAHITTAESGLERVWGGTRFFSEFSVRPDLDNPSVTLSPSAPNPIRRQQGGGSVGFWTGAEPLGAELTDPANGFLLFNADEFRDNEGELFAVRGDVEYEFDHDGWFDAVKFGARVSERDQTNRQSTLNWRGIAAPWEGCCLGYLPLDQLNDQGLYESVDFSDFFRGGVVNGENTNFLFFNSELLGNYDALVDTLRGETLINQVDSDGDGRVEFFEWEPLRQDGTIQYDQSGGGVSQVEESTTNFYARVDLGNEFDNGMSIDANFGLRYAKTKVSGEGFQSFIFNESADVEVGQRLEDFLPQTVAFLRQADIESSGEFNNYTTWLPSVNVKWNLTDNQLLRFGFSENIFRPNISQLRSDRTFGASTTRIIGEVDPTLPAGPDNRPETLGFQLNQIRVNGGNPDLKPIESNNYDLSYELYWNDANAFSVSLFRKELSNNIIYTDQTIGTIPLDGLVVPIVFSGDVNQDEATINGVEVAYTQFYDNLPGLLGNLGLQANYTFLDAATNAPTAFLDQDGDGQPDAGSFERIFRFGVDNFPGLSEHAFNVIGIYQSEDIEFRLAYNWRDDYLSSYRDFVSGNPIFQEQRGYLDGSLKFDINDNLQFRAQVANILDTKAKASQQITQGGQRFGRTSFVGDRRIKVGLRYQF